MNEINSDAVDAITPADGYKLGHAFMAIPGTRVIQSNMTPRTSRVPDQKWIVSLGLQMFLQQFLMDKLAAFFSANINDIAEEYSSEINEYTGRKDCTADHIRRWHALGYTPLSFRVLPEGSFCPLRVPYILVENTHPDEDFSWLVNYFETVLSNENWGVATSATTAVRLNILCRLAAIKTGSPLEFVPWQAHDFSARGMFGHEASILSGVGHLVAFNGSDTFAARNAIKKFYGGAACISGSVLATEHMIMCLGGKDGEKETFIRLLTKFDTGIISIVSDTWNLWNVLLVILPEIKELILSRNGKLVIRPDSGDPVLIVCGDPDAPEGSPERKGVIQILWELFGGTLTSTGHKLLDSHIGCIYGDGITYERMDAILTRLEAAGFASANMVFGVGSYTYQYVTRDTYGFAIKATWADINGVGVDLFKDPITDDGTKKSATGRLAVHKDENGEYFLINKATVYQEIGNQLEEVWRNGYFLKKYTFDEIRARVNEGIERELKKHVNV